MNAQLLERHKPHVPTAGAKEATNWVCATAVLREPPLTGHGIGTGADTDGEAGAPKAIHRNRKTSGSHGDGWVGYDR